MKQRDRNGNEGKGEGERKKSFVKFKLTNLDKGNPYPNPAIGALKSLAWKSSSKARAFIVVYMYVQISGLALLGIPPP